MFKEILTPIRSDVLITTKGKSYPILPNVCFQAYEPRPGEKHGTLSFSVFEEGEWLNFKDIPEETFEIENGVPRCSECGLHLFVSLDESIEIDEEEEYEDVFYCNLCHRSI